MIDRVSNATAPSAGAETGQKPVVQKNVQHTPFGDVMVDELSATNVFGLVTGGSGDVHAEGPTPAAPAPPVPSGPSATAPVSLASASAMTAEALFGDHPWLDSPGGSGPGGSSWSYNPVYFATRQTAERIADLLGGKVVEQNALTPFGPLQQQVANEMIELPNGKVVNAGIIADFFAHGYPQSFVDRLLQLETKGA